MESGTGAGSPEILATLQVTRSSDLLSFGLDVTNISDSDVALRFRDGQSAEFTVVRGDEVVWRWSEGQMFTQAIRTERLGSGETRRYDGQWQVPPALSGEFVATGRWMAEGRMVEQSTRITLP